jgi:hypothetical protein
MLPFGESDWTRGPLPVLMSNVKAQPDRMVELVETMLKLHVKRVVLTTERSSGIMAYE